MVNRRAPLIGLCEVGGGVNRPHHESPRLNSPFIASIAGLGDSTSSITVI